MLDAIAWAVALASAAVFRYEFDVAPIVWLSLLGAALTAASVQYFAGMYFHLYRGRFAYGSFEEVRALTFTVLITMAVIAVLSFILIGPTRVPRSTAFIAAPIALVLMLAMRYARRLFNDRRLKPRDDAAPVLIFGAGEVGQRVLLATNRDADSDFRSVGFLDDDPEKRNLWLRGVPVLGTLDDLPRVAERTGAKIVVVAVGRANAELLRRVQDTATPHEIKVMVVPPFAEIHDDHERAADIRDISIEDLIGRQPVDTNVASIASYLNGRRVLVTGAGGSIGSELCRQIVQFGPAELIMLDRDETGLQAAQLATAGHGLLHTKDVVLADIRDAETLQQIFNSRLPEVVFHAAALKHLPMLEQYPDEAWKTNVTGTLNVIEAARSAGVTTFVNISTDKAANPTSVLGHSKRVAEKLTAWAAEETNLRYLSVRFGNVIGSRGSMLPTFQSLIEAGRPVTVTDPEVTRYFMTIPEACQLVVQAGGIGRGGEVLILDMGQPVKILDVAQRMIAMSGKDIEIVFTGLREGEKLHEELVGTSETTERPFHPKISHAKVESIAPHQLDSADWRKRMLSRPRNNETGVIRPLTPEARTTS
ncbi:nucleoside-diphosphate sugar epimerase/dehydratase [Microbacterium sp. NPDC019599]|uniref:polysaccharide biosynthesis protein n=1 Tax=Microbacterium sp. NPDC019599 TaxID=3154690 RepID=UPI00340AF870